MADVTFLDEACGRVQPPDLYAPAIPEECPHCQVWLEELDDAGCCPECGGQIEW